eukprot:574933-Rhodomonas_salina.2
MCSLLLPAYLSPSAIVSWYSWTKLELTFSVTPLYLSKIRNQIWTAGISHCMSSQLGMFFGVALLINLVISRA